MSAGVRRRIGAIARETLLTCGALLGVICIALVVGAHAFGITMLVFESGSMSPKITTGAAALAVKTDADDLAPGDVVSVTDSAGRRITHRIVAADEIADGSNDVTLTLQGDANLHPDDETYRVAEADRVIWSANGLGYVISALSSPISIFTAGGSAALLCAIVFRRRSRTENITPSDHHTNTDLVRRGQGTFVSSEGVPSTTELDHDGPSARSVASRLRARSRAITGGAAVAVAIGVLAASGSTASLTTPTLAAFSDQASVTSAVATGTIPDPPVSFVCTNGSFLSGYVDVTWQSWSDAPIGYDYQVVATSADGATTIKTWDVSGTTLPINRSDFPASGDYLVSLRGTDAATGWVSHTGPTVEVRAGGATWELNCA
ncbi:hypothetical protein [Paramicrobacterium chengjingii]|uniref:hypothetical protein n=1 Tax=Paramicrobacterium chengjingii TaxID=2769067 RepID=UPI00142394D5|nr:hypothetical protein [Microbacterium chengjingii]